MGGMTLFHMATSQPDRAQAIRILFPSEGKGHVMNAGLKLFSMVMFLFSLIGCGLGQNVPNSWRFFYHFMRASKNHRFRDPAGNLPSMVCIEPVRHSSLILIARALGIAKTHSETNTDATIDYMLIQLSVQASIRCLWQAISLQPVAGCEVQLVTYHLVRH